MPANSRWDLIRRLRVKTVHVGTLIIDKNIKKKNIKPNYGDGATCQERGLNWTFWRGSQPERMWLILKTITLKLMVLILVSALLIADEGSVDGIPVGTNFTASVQTGPGIRPACLFPQGEVAAAWLSPPTPT